MTYKFGSEEKPVTLKELKEQRGKLQVEIQGLAEHQKEGWTRDQQERWIEANQEYDSCMSQIESLDCERRLAELAINRAPAKPWSEEQFNQVEPQKRTGPIFINCKTGQEVRCATKDIPMCRTPEERAVRPGACIASGLLGADILNEAERRALSSPGVPSIPSAWGSAFIDALRPLLIGPTVGVSIVPMEQPTLTLARIDSDVTSSFLAELASDTPSDPSLSAATLNSYRCQTTNVASRESLDDSLNLYEILAASSFGSMSVALDAAMINGAGAGSNEPLGILNTVGVGEIDHTNTIQMSWDIINQGVQTLQDANYHDSLSMLALVVNPREAATLRGEKASTAGTWLGGTGWTSEIRVVTSTGMPLGSAILGDWRNVTMGIRLNFESQWFDSFEAGTVSGVTDFARCHRLVSRSDFLVTRASQFVKFINIPAPS